MKILEELQKISNRARTHYDACRKYGFTANNSRKLRRWTDYARQTELTQIEAQRTSDCAYALNIAISEHKAGMDRPTAIAALELNKEAQQQAQACHSSCAYILPDDDSGTEMHERKAQEHHENRLRIAGALARLYALDAVRLAQDKKRDATKRAQHSFNAARRAKRCAIESEQLPDQGLQQLISDAQQAAEKAEKAAKIWTGAAGL